MPQVEITLSPKPPKQSSQPTVTYTGDVPTELEVHYVSTTGVETTTTVQIGQNGTGSLQIPADAASVKIVDPNGEAAAEASAVLPI